MKQLSFLFLFLLSTSLFSQSSLEELLKKYNDESVPYITVEDLEKVSNDVILLDAREKKEFKVSHIKNAQFVGYEKFDLEKTASTIPNKSAKIVVYCSLGVRSEDVAEQLKKAGFENVFNLYGGIFEWKNEDNPVVNSKNKETPKVHAFSKEWGVWLHKGKKVY